MVATDSATRDSDPSAGSALGSALGSELFVFGSALCVSGQRYALSGQNITPAPRISRRPEKGYD